MKRVDPDKLVSVQLSAPVERAQLARFGEVVDHEDAHASVRVAHAQLRDVVGGIITTLPVLDMTVEDPPLEDVMRQLFAGNRHEDRTPAPAATTAPAAKEKDAS